MRSNNITYFSKKSILFIVPAIIISVLAGSFFGRVNTITCDKKANSCIIVSKGYLYTVYSEEIPMNEIISTHVQLVKDPAPEDYGKKSRPPLNYYSLIIERGMTKPLKVIPNVEVPVHDILNYSIPIFEVSDAMNTYLANPAQNEATFTFGTHRTGIIFTLTILGFLAYWIYSRSSWSLNYSSEKDSVTKDFLDNSGNEEFIERTAYKIKIKRGRSDVLNGIIYLVEGSSLIIENQHLKVKHPYRKKTEKCSVSDIPNGMPAKFMDEILSLKA
jgi:hypothetical protein